MQKVIIIDNYDSFTWNLYQYLCKLGAVVKVYLNDQIGIKDIVDMSPDKIVLSPGPGTPYDSGISLDVVKFFAGKVPILGVCLGHQVIGQVFGANIVKSKRIIHGKAVSIEHDGKGLFYGITSPFNVIRYNSLMIDFKNIPDCLTVSAWTNSNSLKEIMAVRHNYFMIEGVQFHPESIQSMYGLELIQNFLKYSLYK